MAWAPKGAWAQQVEKDDGEAPPPPPEAFPALADLGAKLDQAFPTLGETKDKKVSKKKQKGQVLSLSEFNAGAPIGGGGGGGGAYRPAGARATDLDTIQLPTGPRAREDGEDDGRRPGGMGAGFREFGGDRGGREERGGFSRDDRDGPRRGGYDRDDRGGREDMGPSRADTGDWSKRTGFTPSNDREPRFRDRDGDDDRRPPREDLGPSRADEARDWKTDKKFVPTEPPRRDDRDRRDDRPRDDMGPSRADEENDWRSKRNPPPADDRFSAAPRRAGPGGPSAADTADRWGRREEAPADAPRERPKLQLKPRTVAAEGEEAAGGANGEAAPAKPNPFGTAKPVAVKEVADKPIVPPGPPPERERKERPVERGDKVDNWRAEKAERPPPEAREPRRAGGDGPRGGEEERGRWKSDGPRKGSEPRGDAKPNGAAAPAAAAAAPAAQKPAAPAAAAAAEPASGDRPNPWKKV